MFVIFLHKKKKTKPRMSHLLPWTLLVLRDVSKLKGKDYFRKKVLRRHLENQNFNFQKKQLMSSKS